MPPVELVAAVRDEHERAKARQPARKVVEELTRRGVRPVHVLDHEHEPSLSRGHGEQRDDCLEEPELRLARIASPPTLAAVSELRKELGQFVAGCAEQRAEPFDVLAREVVPDRLDDR